MKNKLVSVILPVYNQEDFLKESIQSVLNQKYKKWELLIIDDNSNDNSKNIANNFSSKYRNIKLLNHDINKGVAKARNSGIKKSEGRFIAFLDSDDIWHPNKLKNQLLFMKSNDFSFTFTSYEIINSNGSKTKKIIEAPKIMDYKKLLKGNNIGCSTVILDRKIINNLKMPSIKHEDYITWLNILKNNINGYGLKQVLTYYRKSNHSITSNKIKSALWTWNIYRNIEELSILNSVYYFINYAINGLKKHYL